MKKFKVFLPALFLACLFISCDIFSATIPDFYPGDNPADSSASTPEEIPDPFPGTVTATENGVKISVVVPANMKRVVVERLSVNEPEVDADVLEFTRKTESSSYPAETLVYEDDLLDAGTTYKYRARFVTKDYVYLSYSDWLSATASAGTGEIKMTNKKNFSGTLDHDTLVYTAGESPVYSRSDLDNFNQVAVCLSYEDDYSSWNEGWLYYDAGVKEFNFLKSFYKTSLESIPVKKIVMKGRYAKGDIPENENFTLIYFDNTTVLEDAFRFENSTGGILSSSVTSGGVELKIHIPYNTFRFQVFRKTPGSSGYSFYANVEDWGVNEPGLFDSYYGVFTDPYVDSGREYSYKVRFIAPGWKGSDFTAPVTVTPSAGKGQVNLENEPAGYLDRIHKQYVFTTKPVFTSLASVSVTPLLVIQYQDPEWSYWNDTALNFFPYSDGEVSYDFFGFNNGLYDELNIQLGVTGVVSGTAQVGFANYSVSYEASNWFYKLPNGSFEWNKDNYYPVDIGSDNGTSYTKSGNKYTFSFSGSGKYNGLYVYEETDPETGISYSLGIFFIKKAGIPFVILDSELEPATGSGTTTSDMSCMVRVEKQGDTWVFLGYEYTAVMEDFFTYDGVSKTWDLDGAVLKLSSETTSITASQGVLNDEGVLVPLE